MRVIKEKNKSHVPKVFDGGDDYDSDKFTLLRKTKKCTSEWD